MCMLRSAVRIHTPMLTSSGCLGLLSSLYTPGGDVLCLRSPAPPRGGSSILGDVCGDGMGLAGGMGTEGGGVFWGGWVARQ